MKHRNPAQRRQARNKMRLASDPQVKKWTQRLLADPEALPSDLTEEQLRFVCEQVFCRRDMKPKDFEQAMIETTPALAAPDFTDAVEDLGHIFSQPEMVSFWGRWTGPKGARGGTPNYDSSKAVLSYAAMTGQSAHLDNAYEKVASSNRLRSLFASVSAAATVTVPTRTLELLRYVRTTQHADLLGNACWREAVRTNVEMVRELARLNPNAGIGKRLLIDGSPFAAWCRQRGSNNDPSRELELRKHNPDAGFRSYSYSRGEKRPITSSDPLLQAAQRGTAKYWRGYYVVVIADQASGLPLVWMLMDATNDEAAAIVPLLSDLYRLWPDIPAEVIVGDSAFDEDALCRLAEVDYGLAPVFRIHPSLMKKGGRTLDKNESRDGSVHAVDYAGRLMCTAHRQWLEFETVDRPKRIDQAGNPLRPGQSTNESAFRVRATCNHKGKHHPCGRVGLRMKVDWSALTRYPHYPSGNPKRYAERQALLLRLNQVESIFNRLKSGGLGVQGAARARVRSLDAVRGLVSLSLLGMTALQLADERIQHGVATPSLPPVPLAPTTTAPTTVVAPPRLVPAKPNAVAAAVPAATAPATVPSPAAPQEPASMTNQPVIRRRANPALTAHLVAKKRRRKAA